MYRSTRLIICQIYIQRSILCVRLGRRQYAIATQIVHCEVSNKSGELDLSWSNQHR